jgi:hypothetical protein
MTWSINWDAVNTCATSFQYAHTYQTLFNPVIPLSINKLELNINDKQCKKILTWHADTEIKKVIVLRKASKETAFTNIGEVDVNHTYDVQNFEDDFLENGSYTYKLNGLTQYNQVFSSNEITTQAYCNSGNQIKIFPNPTTEKFTISMLNFTAKDDIVINIIDFRSTVLLTKKIKAQLNNLIELDVKSLAVGNYILQIKNSEIGAFSQMVCIVK